MVFRIGKMEKDRSGSPPLPRRRICFLSLAASLRHWYRKGLNDTCPSSLSFSSDFGLLPLFFFFMLKLRGKFKGLSLFLSSTCQICVLFLSRKDRIEREMRSILHFFLSSTLTWGRLLFFKYHLPPSSFSQTPVAVPSLLLRGGDIKRRPPPPPLPFSF